MTRWPTATPILFGFGNVLSLALKLQVSMLVAPLVAPAVDLTVWGREVTVVGRESWDPPHVPCHSLLS
jgi:hypothetical protein